MRGEAVVVHLLHICEHCTRSLVLTPPWRLGLCTLVADCEETHTQGVP